MYKSLLGFLAVIFVCTGVAFAAGSGPSTKPRQMVLRGTLSEASSADIDASIGACNFSSWVDQCSNDSCECVTVAAKLTGSGLKGSTVTDFFVTLDPGLDPAPLASGACVGIRGAVQLTDKNSNDTTVNLIGVACTHVRGISKKNPEGTQDKLNLSGGWGIDSSTLPISGWGTSVGTIKIPKGTPSSYPLTLKLKGWITTLAD